ncbi:MAG: OmpA family protein [Acidobacteriota bacterium]
MKEERKRIVLLSSVLLLVAMSAACAKPKVELSVSKNQIKQGESVSVNWTSKDAKEITLNGESVSKSGTKSFQPTNTITYELIGKRGSKEARDRETVRVEVLARPSITLTAEPAVIEKGKQSRLRWSSQNADKVELPGIGSFGASGETNVAPIDSTTYTATAKGPGGDATASARVTVTGPSGPTTDGDGRDGSEAARDRFRREVKPIFFDFDKSDLRPDAISTLNRNAQFLLSPENRSIVFRVEGNCDPRGSEEYNLALGDKRANAAKTHLISQGVDPSRMDVISNGKRNASGTSEGTPERPPSWAYDRRADFVYVRGGELRPEPSEK